MNLEITREGHLTFSEVFEPIEFENGRGERISVCQRDGRFEILVVDEHEWRDERLLHIIDHRTVEEHNAPGANRILP